MSSAITAKDSQDLFKIGNQTLNSRLIIGTGKYRSYSEMQNAHRASGAEMVTVAVRRVPLDRSSESFLDYLNPSLQILPNTAGCTPLKTPSGLLVSRAKRCRPIS